MPYAGFEPTISVTMQSRPTPLTARSLRPVIIIIINNVEAKREKTYEMYIQY
jgi:hypothetical protein